VDGGIMGVKLESVFCQLRIGGGKNGLSRSSNLFHSFGGILEMLEFFWGSIVMDM
jgi:hypothetical protein